MREHVFEDALKSVVFLGFLNKRTNAVTTVGTAFIVALTPTSDPNRSRDTVLVTARHVVANLSDRGADELYVRFNSKLGKSFWRKTLIEDWLYGADSTVDVASYRSKLPANCDHLALPTATLLPRDNERPFPVDLTDEIVVAGLFSPYQSELRVTPLLRMGNIVALADQNAPVSTPVGSFAAHLLEMRSISGLSGAPVFARASMKQVLTKKVNAKGPHMFLLGLVSGHFVEKELSIRDGVIELGETKLDLNAGVSFVTPTEVIRSHLEQMPPNDGRTRLFFPAHTNLCEGSFFRAIRSLSEKKISEISELFPLMATLPTINAGIDQPQPINAKAMARLILSVSTEELRQGGWDGTTV